MQVLLARLPDLIGLSGLTVGITALQQATILNNSGTAQSLTNQSGDIFYANLDGSWDGWYNVDVYHNSNYVAQGSVKFAAASGYYLVDDPVVAHDDLYDDLNTSISGINTTVSSINTTLSSLAVSLVVPAASVPTVSGVNISIFKGVTWDFNISGIGNNAANFFFTMKTSSFLPDSSASLQISKSGMTYLNQTEVSNVSGILTYSADNGGTLNVSADPVVTSQIQAGTKYVWDVKSIDTDVNIVSYGSLVVKEDVTDRIL